MSVRLVTFRVVVKDDSEERIKHLIEERGPLILRHLESTMQAHGLTCIRTLGGKDLPVTAKVITDANNS